MYTLYIGNKNYSTWSLRAWVLMKTLGIAFHEKQLALYRPDTPARIRPVSPSSRVPCLHDGEVVVWDSLAIAEYLAERHPGVWPADAIARAWARSAAAEMHSGFARLRDEFGMNVKLRSARSPSVAVAAEIARIVELWREGRERFGHDGDFLCGAFTAVDAFWCPVAFRFQSYDVALDGAAAAYCRALLALPAMREWAADAADEGELSTGVDPRGAASAAAMSPRGTEVSEVLAGWRDRVKNAAAAKTPLRLVGGGTKDFYGQELVGERFDTTAYAGIVDYDPTELVITARCGTPLVDVERTLAEGGQMLGFEPPRFGDAATLGGCIAAGLAGPRRPYAGAIRDLVLGVRLLDGRGEDLSFGGRVMKNVAGFDVSRVLAGSLGTLGIVLEASLKCLPQPKVEASRVLELTADKAIQRMNEWGGRPLPLTATCYCDGRLHARFAGAESAVAAALREVGGRPLEEADAFWSSLREQRHEFFADRERDAPLWRLSVRTTAPFSDLGGAQLLEWGGGLRWLKANGAADAARLRAWAQQQGGHATLFRAADKSPGVFQRPTEPLMAIQRGLKAAFDPEGIFNRHRMYVDF